MRIGKQLAPALAAAAILLAGALPGAASATTTTFNGADDGASVGGTFTNSNVAFSNFLGSALSYGSTVTTGFSEFATGFSTSYALTAATLTLAADNYGSGFSGISNTTFGGNYGFDVGNGSGKWLGFPAGSATLTFAGSSNAVGFYTTGLQTTFGAVFQVNYDNGTSQTIDIPVNTDGGVSFFGLVDTNSFSSITISRPGTDAWGIDNLTYAFPSAVADVPEPSTWAMMILGLAGIGASLRRRRRAGDASPTFAFA